MKFLLVFLLLLSACQTLGLEDEGEVVKKDEVQPEKMTAAEIYNDAQESLEKKNYKTAAESFLDVERQHPYSKWATKAQVQAAYAYYKDGQYDDAKRIFKEIQLLQPQYKKTDKYLSKVNKLVMRQDQSAKQFNIDSAEPAKQRSRTIMQVLDSFEEKYW